MNKIPPTHPGEILMEEFMKPLGLSQNSLAKELSVTPKTVNEIVNRKRSITGNMALRLSRLFGTTPEFWMNLQQHHDLELAKDAIAAQIRKSVTPIALRAAKLASA